MDDTVLERNKDIQQNEDWEKTLNDSKSSQNHSEYGDSSDEDNVVITIGESSSINSGVKDISPNYDSNKSTKSNDITNDREISRSDSMIPLVGDSILAQDVTIDNLNILISSKCSKSAVNFNSLCTL